MSTNSEYRTGVMSAANIKYLQYWRLNLSHATTCIASGGYKKHELDTPLTNFNTDENPDSSSTPKCQEKQLRDEAGAVRSAPPFKVGWDPLMIIHQKCWPIVTRHVPYMFM